MFCKNCGNEIKDGVEYCSRCGNRCNISGEIKASVSKENADSEVIGHKYRFRCCGGVSGRMRIIALPLYYLIVFFLGDTIDFIFQKSTLKLYSSKLNIEEPYNNIKNIYFQDNVPFKRNFPLTVSLIISFLIVAILTNSFQSDFISILSIILTLAASLFLKFGKKKRTAIIIEYKEGKKLFIPMKKLNEKKLQLKEQFLNDIQSIIRKSKETITTKE